MISGLHYCVHLTEKREVRSISTFGDNCLFGSVALFLACLHLMLSFSFEPMCFHCKCYMLPFVLVIFINDLFQLSSYVFCQHPLAFSCRLISILQGRRSIPSHPLLWSNMIEVSCHVKMQDYLAKRCIHWSNSHGCSITMSSYVKSSRAAI